MFIPTRLSRNNVAIALVLSVIGSATLLISQASAAGGPQCTSPYVQVQGAGILPNTNTAFNIGDVSVGEPFVTCTKKQITFVLKVQTMNPVPPQGRWLVSFLVPANKNTSGIATAVQVGYDSSGTRAAAPAFILSYSRTDPTTMTSSGGVCTAVGANSCSELPTGTVNPDGTITFNLDITNTISFAAITGGDPAWSIDPSVWGTFPLTQITGQTDIIFGAGLVTEFDLGYDATNGDGTYTLQGNLACSAPPVAVLAAVPTSGNVPLTVNFDAGASTPGQCGTISSYNFFFGDGQQVSLAGATTSHTYTNGGATYHARVTVTSTSGLTSGNIAQQDIVVNTAGPPLLNSVVSRATHTGVGDFDVNLNLPPNNSSTNPRGVECRNTGTAGNYKLVFTFLNTLVTPAPTPTVTTGTVGTVSGAMGPNSNQYTVNLTGVNNAQYVGVTLLNAKDSTGALGTEPEVQMGALLADVNASGSVDSSDLILVKQQTLQPVTSSNFREDVNTSGGIDSADLITTKQKTLTGLPTPP